MQNGAITESVDEAHAIDAGVRALRRCKWYRESDHILTLACSMLRRIHVLLDVDLQLPRRYFCSVLSNGDGNVTMAFVPNQVRQTLNGSSPHLYVRRPYERAISGAS